MAKEGHPFYCGIKRCRKSAWETPEYLSAEDWSLLRQVLACDSAEAFAAAVFASRQTAESFFWRVVGWPEGLHYMRDPRFAESTGWPGLQKHSLVKASEALILHEASQVPMGA